MREAAEMRSNNSAAPRGPPGNIENLVTSTILASAEVAAIPVLS